MALFEVGDRVEVLDEVMHGKVVAVFNDEITIESEDGFMMNFMPNELVKISDASPIKVSNFEVAQVKSEEGDCQEKKTIGTKT